MVEKPSPQNPEFFQGASEVINLVSLMQVAWKNYSLYPEGHVNAIKTIANLESAFNSYFSSYDALQLNIEKNRLLFDGNVVHEVSPSHGTEDLVVLLYRDGIQLIDFLPGLSQDELIYFFSILKKFRALAEEAEGDVVTGLNDGNLEHINFKAIDIFWEDLPPLDFSTLKAELPETGEPGPAAEAAETVESEDSGRLPTKAKSIADPSISNTLWEISPAEQQELQKMVQEEENWDNSEDVLEVLLVILRSQTDQYNFSSVLDFALEEVTETIQQGEFVFLRNFFQSLYQLLYSDASIELNWRRPVIERFFQDLSNPEIFHLIVDKLKKYAERNVEEIQVLREVLLYFSPAIINSLGPVLLETGVPTIKKMIMEVMEYLCLRDMEPMEILLDHPDRKLAELLLPLLARIRGERSQGIFFKMSEHPSEIVRGEAIRILLDRDPQSILKLFHLIDDPNLDIRRLILKGVASQKSSVLENLLLKHINENINHRDPEYILACYAALGRCGSSKSVPHLSRILLERGWNRFIGLGKPVHREGAAVALALLNNHQAENVLLKASKSKLPAIRDAYQKAMSNMNTAGDKTHG